MSTSTFPTRADVTQCLEEVHKIQELLKTLNENTGMEAWSRPIGQDYRMVVDDLDALAAHLQVFRHVQWW